MTQGNGRSDNEGMAEFAKQLWERYMRQRVISDLLKHSLDGYKAKVVSNNGNGTLTVIRPYDAQSLTLKCPPALATWAAAGDQVLVVSLGDASNSFILCATDIDGFDLDILSDQDPVMNAADADPGTSSEASRADHVHPSDTSRVPTSRTINGYDLTQDVTLTAADVGALASGGTAVAAKRLQNDHSVETSGGWYKVFELTSAEINRSYNMTMLIDNGYLNRHGILTFYLNHASNGSFSGSAYWLATDFPLTEFRFLTDDTTKTFTLYASNTQGILYFRILAADPRNPNNTYFDPSSCWASDAVSEPTTATLVYAPLGYPLKFDAVPVSAGTNQVILTVSDERIRQTYELVRIEFADPSYITTGYTWDTSTGTFTVTGTATAATTANILLIRRSA